MPPAPNRSFARTAQPSRPSRITPSAPIASAVARERPPTQQRGGDHRRERDPADDQRAHSDVRDVPGQHQEEDRRDADERDADDQQQHRDRESPAGRSGGGCDDGCRHRRPRWLCCVGDGRQRRGLLDRAPATARATRCAAIGSSATSAAACGAARPRPPPGGLAVRHRHLAAHVHGDQRRRHGLRLRDHPMNEPDRLDQLLSLRLELDDPIAEFEQARGPGIGDHQPAVRTGGGGRQEVEAARTQRRVHERVRCTRPHCRVFVGTRHLNPQDSRWLMIAHRVMPHAVYAMRLCVARAAGGQGGAPARARLTLCLRALQHAVRTLCAVPVPELVEGHQIGVRVQTRDLGWGRPASRY